MQVSTMLGSSSVHLHSRIHVSGSGRGANQRLASAGEVHIWDDRMLQGHIRLCIACIACIAAYISRLRWQGELCQRPMRDLSLRILCSGPTWTVHKAKSYFHFQSFNLSMKKVRLTRFAFIGPWFLFIFSGLSCLVSLPLPCPLSPIVVVK